MAHTQSTMSKKSGRGIRDGVVSELTAFFAVKPGHADQLRAACRRMDATLHRASADEVQKTGLRDSRFVLFDNDQRLLWTTTFETDWDPYLDDALLVVGVDSFIDWMQHLDVAQIHEWFEKSGGRDSFVPSDDPKWAESVKAKSAGLKQIIQDAQVPAASYWNALAEQTVPQIKKGQRVDQAFQEVLDDPAAAEALKHPAMKPLLEQAAD